MNLLYYAGDEIVELPGASAEIVRALMTETVARMRGSDEQFETFDRRFAVDGVRYLSSRPEPGTTYDTTFGIAFDVEIDLDNPGARSSKEGISRALIEWSYDPIGFADDQVTDMSVNYWDLYEGDS